MRDPGAGAAQQPTETLQVGPSRPPLSEKVPTRWGPSAVAVLAFVVGVAAGGGAVLWTQPRPAPPFVRGDEHAVELVLVEAAPLRARSTGRTSDIGPMQVDGVLLLSGLVTSTVVGIGVLDDSLDVRAPALPVTVSPTGRLESVTLELRVRDCTAASRWTPGDRPFSVSWRDEYGRAHLDKAGDFGGAVARALTRYVDAVCDNPLGR